MKQKLLALSVLLSFAGIYSCKTGSSDNSEQKFITTANMDSSVKPGDDFFMYVNGKWIKNALIPPTESGVGSFLDVYNVTKGHVHSILDSVAKGGFEKGSIAQKVGDFYASAMDSAAIEKLGYDPIKPRLQQIAAFTDAKSVLAFEGQMQTTGYQYIVASGIGSDQKNSNMNILNTGQAGLGLPDRDYYFRTDPATVGIQNAYKAYMKKTFMMLGDDSVTAAKKVAVVYALETEIAKSHRTNVELRDPQSNYNKMAVADMDKKEPNIAWPALLNEMGMKADSVNVGQPAYYTKLNTLLKTTPIDTWKAYYEFHVTDDAAPALSSAFVKARFDYQKLLSGQKEMRPRWERMYHATDASLGDALGELYVKRYFTDDAKKRMLDLVNNLQKAFEARINKVDWMSDSTKKVAIDKLHGFIKKIGYTDKWRDYSKVTIDKNSYFDNIVSCNKNDYQYQLSKLGKPVDKTEWGMTPPTINAYYNPSFNEIVFPAGILQFPFFDPNADDAINYGGIGMVIGHEMTHGFDDQGSQYDKEGNLKNWWSHNDSLQFVQRTKKIINQFNGYTMLDTMHINGALTTGENSADLGGINIAYDAFKMTKEGQDTTKIDGFTPDQRFFISFAQAWRTKQTDESIRSQMNQDPHSPPIYRVNGPLSNCDAFYTAFNVQPGDKMYKPESERVKIW